MTGEEDLELKRLQLRKMIKLASQLAGGQAARRKQSSLASQRPSKSLRRILDLKVMLSLRLLLSSTPGKQCG
jgi:hypothetical protein